MTLVVRTRRNANNKNEDTNNTHILFNHNSIHGDNNNAIQHMLIRSSSYRNKSKIKNKNKPAITKSTNTDHANNHHSNMNTKNNSTGNNKSSNGSRTGMMCVITTITIGRARVVRITTS